MRSNFDVDRFVAVLRDLGPQLQEIDGTQGWLAALRFGVAGGLADMGEGKAAAPLFRRILADSPTHLWAWIGLVDIALDEGDPAAAIAVGLEAMGHLPHDPVLRRKTAEAAEKAEGAAAALSILCDQPMDEMRPGDMAYAVALHRAMGDVMGASDLYERLILAHPDITVAHLALIEAHFEKGDIRAAVAAAETALSCHPADPEIILRASQAFQLAQDPQRAASLVLAAPSDTRFMADFMDLARDIAKALGDTDLARRLLSRFPADQDIPSAPPSIGRLDPCDTPKQCNDTVDPVRLFEQLDDALTSSADDVADSLAQLVAHPDLPWYLAFRIVERLWCGGAPDAAAALSITFATASLSDSDRQAFMQEDLLLRHGPHAALDWTRANPVARRDAEACERMGRVLLAKGAGQLAARYLRRCCHQWPQNAQLLHLATEALIASGAAAQVPSLVDASECADSARLACRTAAALDQGDIHGVMTIFREAEAYGVTPQPRIALIEAQILAGHLAAAEATLSHLSIDNGALEEAMICRPRATRVGSLLNEARILSGLAEEEAIPDQLSRDFFLPARAKLTASLDRISHHTTSKDAIPAIVHIVHRGPPLTPQADAALQTAWRAATGHEVQIHDLRNAPSWLNKSLGKPAAKAFAMAPDPAQKGDLILLAVLLMHGGMAFGADQIPSGNINLLQENISGAVTFQEGTGALSLDALFATASHPLIVGSLDQIISACLSQDKDHRWFKTGPGLLTRTLATLPQDLAETVTIRRLADLRRTVHPYRPAIMPKRLAPLDIALGRVAKKLVPVTS